MRSQAAKPNRHHPRRKHMPIKTLPAPQARTETTPAIPTAAHEPTDHQQSKLGGEGLEPPFVFIDETHIEGINDAQNDAHNHPFERDVAYLAARYKNADTKTLIRIAIFLSRANCVAHENARAS